MDSPLFRFTLHNGQFFGEYRLKNQTWKLNGIKIGFGDLRQEDIDRIQKCLTDDETFEGFNEHHGTEFQQFSNPMIIITSHEIAYPTRVR